MIMTFQKDPEQNETKHLHQFADFTGKHVLEIGCGEGRLTWHYAAKPAVTIAIDTDKDALRVATIDRPSDLEDKVHFSNASAEWLPFAKETFDIALLSWSF
jgi:ubiquinone/menaquinone biosynthesis C-methylase UbiE